MAKLKDIVVDAELPSALARFWAAALDGYAVRPYDDAEIARLAALGFTPETDPVVMVDGPGPGLCFQKRRPDLAERGRLHLDIATRDPRAEIRRLQALGATLLRQHDARTTVMRDPEGNAFCVVAVDAAPS
jgi:hypothetical protein